MEYPEFKKLCEDSMENAIKMYGAEATGPVIIDNGMDDDCLAFVMSEEYLIGL